jgi:hypothetical protein
MNGGTVPRDKLITRPEQVYAWEESEADDESEGSLRGFVASDSEESDDEPVVKSTKYSVKTVLKPVINENTTKRVYSIETLKSMIPSGTEFQSLRDRMIPTKLVYRYSPEVSNRTFKRRYFFKTKKVYHGTKVPVIIRGNDLIPVKGKKFAKITSNPPFGGKPIKDRVLYKDNVEIKRRPIWMPKALFGLKKIESRDRKSYKVLRPNRLPRRHHKKYWYFLRKRGFYETSSHHPYGDEYEAYASDPT